MAIEHNITLLSPLQAEKACREISNSLPEWFGIPEANERYAFGVKERLCFGYYKDDRCLGMLCLEFPFPNAAQVYWLGVNRQFLNQGIGKTLLWYAESFCVSKKIYSLTVETLSPKEGDVNYLKTWNFYLKQGFKPLFELTPYGPNLLMAYLHKILSPKAFTWVDLTHKLEANIPTWEGTCGFKHNDISTYEDDKEGCSFLIQHIEMLAGIGTHMDAPAHCFPQGKTIENLPLDTLLCPCIVIDVSKEAHENYCVPLQIVKDFELKHSVIWQDTFVIFSTGWQRYWQDSEKYRRRLCFPTISKEAAAYLVSKGIAGIGIDTLSPDGPDGGYPVHQIVLGAGAYLVENVANAPCMPAIGGYAFAIPLKVASAAEAPIRLLGVFIS